MDLTVLRTIALAALVLGTAGTLSTTACRLGLCWVDPTLFPAPLLARARWWTSHMAAAFRGSLVLILLGVVGLVLG
ncbi:MAG TPA: hypothetical protein VHW44_27680 [Pseudonocardiaceae bacterium]|jgi:hypothetical protein|nr:hypothetical protein [Pseudonocardiaceae bacterium]